MKTTARWLIALCAAATLAACGLGLLGNQGRLRLVNATTGVGSLDLFIEGETAMTGIPALSASDYVFRRDGSYQLDLRQTGNVATILTTSTSFVADKHQSMVVYNSGGTVAATFLDDEEGDPGRNKAKFRIFNTATGDADKVDVYTISDPCTALEASPAAPIASAVSGLQSSYTELGAGTTGLHVCVTTAGDKRDVRLDIPAFVFSDQRIVTLILVRGAGGYLMNAIVVDQQDAATPVRNASARARVATSVPTPASVTVNGTPVASALPTARVGTYVVVPAGPVTLKVNDADVTAVPTLVAEPGADLTVLLMGSAPAATLLVDDNAPSGSAARPARLRLVNGLDNGGSATLSLNGAVFGGSVAPDSASAYGTVEASAGHAQLEAVAGGVSLFSRNDVTFESGRVYTLFLLGDAAGTSKTGILVQDR